MKKISILLFIVGIIITIGLVIYFRGQVNPVDSDAMTIDRSGNQVSEWPIFIGIILTFVGGVFFYAAIDEEKKKA